MDKSDHDLLLQLSSDVRWIKLWLMGLTVLMAGLYGIKIT